MGVSTDGLLVFGMSLSGESDSEGYSVKVPWAKSSDPDYEDWEDDDQDDEEDIETWWEKQHGISSDELWAGYYEWEKLHKTGEYLKDRDLVDRYEKLHPEFRIGLDKYYEDRKKVAETCPVELIRHCSGDYPMYFLAVKGHTYSASRGYPVEVEDLNVDPKALEAFKAFCAKYGIEYTEPKWYLASLWW